MTSGSEASDAAGARARRLRPRIPGAVWTLGRILGLSVTEVGSYWRAEREALKRGFTALTLAALVALAAGLVLGAAEHRLAELPGLIILIPAAIAMRGSTFGAMGARIGTATHTGEFGGEFEPGGYLWRQLEAVAVLTLFTGFIAAVLARTFAVVLGLPSIPVWDLVVIAVVGGVIAALVLVIVTIGLVRAAYARGWNMDDVAAPAITSMADLIAVPALLAASFLAHRGTITVVLAVMSTLATVGALWHGFRHPRPEIRRIVRESTGVLSLACTSSILAGIIIQEREDVFLAVPALLVLVPPFLAMFGSLGGMLSSRLTSKLHIGVLEPRLLPGRAASLDFSLSYLYAVVMFTFVGLVTWGASFAIDIRTPVLGRFTAVALVAGVFGTLALTGVAYTAATATYRFGLDPDNHAIPIVTSAMDFIGILCLVAAMAMLGLGI